MSEHDRELEEEENSARGFRVVDRRRFTEEGEARDSDEEESAVAEPSAAPTPASAVEGPTSSGLDDDDGEKSHGAPDGQEETPIDFIAFVASLATNAMAAMGALPEAQSHGIPRNPDLAREYIDICAMLEIKTRGNRSPQEDAAITRMVSDLKMAYVQLTGDFKS